MNLENFWSLAMGFVYPISYSSLILMFDVRKNSINSLPDDSFLDWSKLKVFADEKIIET